MDLTMICRVILGVATFKYSQDYDKYTVESIIKLLLNKFPDSLTSLTPFLDILLELAKLYPCFWWLISESSLEKASFMVFSQLKVVDLIESRG